MDESVEIVLRKVCEKLKPLPGIAGAVLGGSRARGLADADSDTDIGVYYLKDRLDCLALDSALAELDDKGRRNLLNGPGEWGEWVDGGAWLTVSGEPVDIILRDIGRVAGVIEDASAGKVSLHYQTGHPHAFVSSMYMGELAISRVLLDDNNTLRELKIRTSPYPRSLMSAIVRLCFFEAGFSLLLAQKALRRDDLYYVTAHAVRSLSSLNQVLFAVNGEYCLNEKNAVRMIENFELRPPNYKNRVERIIAGLAHDTASSCAELSSLVDDTSIIAANSGCEIIMMMGDIPR